MFSFLSVNKEQRSTAQTSATIKHNSGGLTSKPSYYVFPYGGVDHEEEVLPSDAVQSPEDRFSCSQARPLGTAYSGRRYAFFSVTTGQNQVPLLWWTDSCERWRWAVEGGNRPCFLFLFLSFALLCLGLAWRSFCTPPAWFLSSSSCNSLVMFPRRGISTVFIAL